MWKNQGQFDVPDNTRVETEFPCSKCGEPVRADFPIKENHRDETAGCPACGEDHDVTVMHDAGTGTVTVHGVDPKKVKAQGIA